MFLKFLFTCIFDYVERYQVTLYSLYCTLLSPHDPIALGHTRVFLSDIFQEL